MAVNAAVRTHVLQDRLNKRALNFVQLPRFDNRTGKRVLVVRQETLGERRRALLRLRIRQAHFVERFGNADGRPDLHGKARFLFDPRNKFLLALQQFLFCALGPVEVYPNAAPGHVEQARQQIRFEFPDVPEFFAAQLRFERGPQLQRQLGIYLGVLPDVRRRHLPHLGFGIYAEIERRLIQHLFGLGFA